MTNHVMNLTVPVVSPFNFENAPETFVNGNLKFMVRRGNAPILSKKWNTPKEDVTLFK